MKYFQGGKELKMTRLAAPVFFHCISNYEDYLSLTIPFNIFQSYYDDQLSNLNQTVPGRCRQIINNTYTVSVADNCLMLL